MTRPRIVLAMADGLDTAAFGAGHRARLDAIGDVVDTDPDIVLGHWGCPVLDETRWIPVLTVVRDRLLTPVGLRTLAPGHPDYKPTYDGDLRARDAAYHQGTVWPWLIGPFVEAWLRAHPEGHAYARQLLERFWSHLDEACVGSISEIFDAEDPYTPRGCVAQAWSVAEVLRCFQLTHD